VSDVKLGEKIKRGATWRMRLKSAMS